MSTFEEIQSSSNFSEFNLRMCGRLGIDLPLPTLWRETTEPQDPDLKPHTPKKLLPQRRRASNPVAAHPRTTHPAAEQEIFYLLG